MDFCIIPDRDTAPTVMAHAVRRAPAQMNALRLARAQCMLVMLGPLLRPPHQRCFLPRHCAQAHKLWRQAWATAACAALCALLAARPHVLASVASGEPLPHCARNAVAAVSSVAHRLSVDCEQSSAGLAVVNE